MTAEALWLVGWFKNFTFMPHAIKVSQLPRHVYVPRAFVWMYGSHDPEPCIFGVKVMSFSWFKL